MKNKKSFEVSFKNNMEDTLFIFLARGKIYNSWK